MAPQVGLERCPEILTAEVILLIFRKNAKKSSIDEGFEPVCHLSLKAGKAAESAVGRTKVGHFLGVISVRKLPNEPSKMDGSPRGRASSAVTSFDKECQRIELQPSRSPHALTYCSASSARSGELAQDSGSARPRLFSTGKSHYHLSN